MLKILTTAVAAVMIASPAAAQTPPVTVDSPHDLEETVRRLTAAIEAKGAKVIAVVDHGGAAAKAGLSLEPTKLVIFGNPQLGTPLMQSDRFAGLDLPLKILLWSDDDGAKMSYREPSALAQSYALDGRDEILAKMSGAMKAFTDAAARRD